MWPLSVGHSDYDTSHTSRPQGPALSETTTQSHDGLAVNLPAYPLVYRKLLGYLTLGTVIVLLGQYQVFVLATPTFLDDEWDRAMKLVALVASTAIIPGNAWYDAISGVDVYQFPYLTVSVV